MKWLNCIVVVLHTLRKGETLADWLLVHTLNAERQYNVYLFNKRENNVCYDLIFWVKMPSKLREFQRYLPYQQHSPSLLSHWDEQRLVKKCDKNRPFHTKWSNITCNISFLFIYSNDMISLLLFHLLCVIKKMIFFFCHLSWNEMIMTCSQPPYLSIWELELRFGF